MKVYHLIEMLEVIRDQGFGDSVVLTYDPDAEQVMPVTGAVFGGDAATIQLYTDEV